MAAPHAAAPPEPEPFAAVAPDAAPPDPAPPDPASEPPQAPVAEVPLTGLSPLVSRLAQDPRPGGDVVQRSAEREPAADHPGLPVQGSAGDGGPVADPEPAGHWSERTPPSTAPLLGDRAAPVTLAAPADAAIVADLRPEPIRWPQPVVPSSTPRILAGPPSGRAAKAVQRSTGISPSTSGSTAPDVATTRPRFVPVEHDLPRPASAPARAPSAGDSPREPEARSGVPLPMAVQLWPTRSAAVDEPHPTGAAEETAVPVQTAVPVVQTVAPVEPAPTGAAPEASAVPMPGPGTGPGAGQAAQPSTDELVRRLFDPLAARLKAELRLDRERAGLITDLRR